jgi:hypothetical protein
MTLRKKLFLTFTAPLLLLLAAGCQVPSDASGGRASLTVALSSDVTSGAVSRTVAADFTEQVDTWTIRLSTGGTEVFTGDFVYGSPIAIDDLEGGTYTVTAQGFRSGQITVAGTATVTLIPGQDETLNITVSPAQTTGTGAYSLTLRFPHAAGITAVSYTLDPEVDDPEPVKLTASLSNDEPDRVAVLTGTGIPSGSHRLLIEFERAGAVVVRRLVEAVNIWDNMTSDRWVDPDGALQEERVFTEGDFIGTTTEAAAITFTAGTLNPTFDPEARSYTLTVNQGSYRFQITGAADGQSFRYTFDDPINVDTVWITAYDGYLTEDISVAAGATLTVEVTAPNGDTGTYTFAINRVYRIVYHPNGASGSPRVVTMAAGVPQTLLTQGESGFTATRDGITLRFDGWFDGPEIGSLYTGSLTNTDIDLYARWDAIGGTGPGGGIVFYDKGNYDDGWRYLEVAPGNAGSSMWIEYPDGYPQVLIGLILNGLGAGKSNSLYIVSQADHESSAAESARGYSNNDYSDWYLPSREELQAIRNNLPDEIRATYTLTGWFWSSTEHDSANSIRWELDSNTGTSSSKTGLYPVRPVRAFSGPYNTRMVVYRPEGAEAGSVPRDNRMYPQGSYALAAGNGGLLRRSDSTLLGWISNRNYLGIDTIIGEAIAMGSDHVLYPKWSVLYIDVDTYNLGNISTNGWQSTIYGNPGEIQVFDTGPENIFQYTGSGSGVGASASLVLEDIAFEPGKTYRLSYDVQKNAWGVAFGIAADLDNDGKAERDDSDEHALCVSVTDAGGVNNYLTLPGQPVQSLPYSDVPFEWVTVEIVFTLSNTPAQNLVTVRYKRPADPDWTALWTNVLMGINWSASDKSNPAYWNLLYMHMEGSTGMLKNITLEVVP